MKTTLISALCLTLTLTTAGAESLYGWLVETGVYVPNGIVPPNLFIDLDSDADGASNLWEYVAGTDPKSAQSRPSPMTIKIVDGEAKFKFVHANPFPSDARLILEASEDLSAESWTTVTDRTGGTGWSGDVKASILDAPDGRIALTLRVNVEGTESRYFRLRAVHQP